MSADASFDEPTAVAVYSTLQEAEIAQSHLDENDIDSFITRDDVGGMHPEMQMVQGVRLMVRSGEAIEARQVLEWMDAVPDRQIVDSDDPEEKAARREMWRDVGTVLLGFGSAMLVAAVIVWTIAGWEAATIAAVAGGIAGIAGGVARLVGTTEEADSPTPA